MAKSTQETIELGRLIRRSEAARLQIGLAHTRLKRKLDLPSRLKNSVKSEPAKWLGGSVVAGFVASFLFKLKKGTADRKTGKGIKRGFSLGLLRFVLKLAKPAAKIYASKLIKDYLGSQLRKGISERSTAEERARY